MCCVCTLQHCTQLGVPHSRLFARGTDRPYSQEEHLFSQHTVYLVPSTTHSLPGPMPTLMMSAPLSISSSTISPVTTLPAYTHHCMSPKVKQSHIQTYHDGVGWEIFPCLTYKRHKVLRVSIGYIKADILDVRNRVDNLPQLFQIFFTATRAHCYILKSVHKGGAKF